MQPVQYYDSTLILSQFITWPGSYWAKNANIYIFKMYKKIFRLKMEKQEVYLMQPV